MIPVAELHREVAPFLATLVGRRRVDAEDLEQSVWLRVVERAAGPGLPRDLRSWLRGLAVREVLTAARTADAETPVARVTRSHYAPEDQALEAYRRRAVREALAGLPGRCPELLAALAAFPDLTYQQLAGLLGMPRGSIGPTRSRCLACLRALLTSHRAE